MASRREEKERRKAERLEKERQMMLAERRRKRRNRFAMAAGIAAFVLLWVLLLANAGNDQSGPVKGVDQVTRSLQGIPQAGQTLGRADAKVEIVEYGDPQCPVCATFSNQVLPGLVDRYVRDGQVKFTFRPWAFLGEDSNTAARAYLAAAEQNRGLAFIELLYRNQGPENSGYVTDEYLEKLARAAGVDVARFNEDRKGFERELVEVAAEAQKHGFEGTPSFVVRGPGGEQTFTGGDPRQIEQAIAKVSGDAR